MEITDIVDAQKYLLKYIRYYIDKLMDNVVDDSEEDPEYSAVTLNNLIICYIRCEQALDHSFPISTVRDFFLFTGFYTLTSYLNFEEKRKKESAYYVGEQFSELPET